jgi:hypothetical protein
MPVKPPNPQRSDREHKGPFVEGFAVLFKQGQIFSVKLVIPGIACIQGGNLAPMLINTYRKSLPRTTEEIKGVDT